MAKGFLPVNMKEARALGWDAPDFVSVTGDAYVDHPSFGLAIISRVLEAAGYRVAMLCQPDWHHLDESTSRHSNFEVFSWVFLENQG